MRAQVIREVSPVLNVSPRKIGKAFDKLGKNYEIKLLDSLLLRAGDELLPLLPELAEFPEPEVILEAFLAEYKSDEDPLMLDPDFADPDDDEAIHDIIHATERARLLKTVLYFWHLAKVGGRELAKDTLTDLLHALALYQLLMSSGLTELQVKYHSQTLTLPPDFKDILQNRRVGARRGDLKETLEIISQKVLIELEESDDFLLERAVKTAHDAVDAVTSKERTETVTLRGFSHALLEEGMAESLADVILDAGVYS